MPGARPPPWNTARHPGRGRSPPGPLCPDFSRQPSERWTVITNPTTRPATGRRQPQATDRAEGKLQEVVSVRFSEEELRRIQAFAVIFETTPNGVIREACSFFLAQKVGSREYREALEAYHRRNSEVVNVLEQIPSAQ